MMNLTVYMILTFVILPLIFFGICGYELFV